MKSDIILKWIATVILIIGSVVNSLGYYPAGPIVLITGSAIWLIVSFMWKESALIITNGALVIVSSVALLYHIYG
jgi:hypothetical protein